MNYRTLCIFLTLVLVFLLTNSRVNYSLSGDSSPSSSEAAK